MKNTLRFVTYIAACVAVYLIIVASTGSGVSINTSKVVAFEREVDAKIYFAMDTSKGACAPVDFVTKKIYNAETLGLGALEKLLAGTSPNDRRKGFVSTIDPDVRLVSFEVKDGTAYVEFDKPISSDPESCAYKTAMSQIEKTLTSLPDVQKVVLK